MQLTYEELEIVYNAMEYAFDALDSDMSLMDEESQKDIQKLDALKDRIQAVIEAKRER